MIESDNIPGNQQSATEILKNIPISLWILIAILIFLIIVLFVIIIYSNLIKNKKIKKLEKFNEQNLSEEEYELLIKYRKLNITDKAIIDDTVNTLNKNHKKNDEKSEQ